MKSFLCWSLFTFSFAVNAFEVDTALDNFFQLYKAGRLNNAVEQIHLVNRDRNESDGLPAITDKQSELRDKTQALGTFLGQELLGKHEIGNRLQHLTYLLIHENEPARLEFAWYRPVDKWVLTSLEIDANLASELKELARKDIAGFLVQEDIQQFLQRNRQGVD